VPVDSDKDSYGVEIESRKTWRDHTFEELGSGSVKRIATLALKALDRVDQEKE